MPDPSLRHPLHPPPFGLRIGAILCVATGFYTALARLAAAPTWLAGHADGRAWPLLLGDMTGAGLLLVGGVLVWLRRRAGLAVVIAGVVIPAIVRVAVGVPVALPGWPLLAGLALIAVNARRMA